MQNLHAYQPYTRESKRNQAPKRTKTTEEHNRNQSKKQSSENSITISARKNPLKAQKAKEKDKTAGKKYSERKTRSGANRKSRKGDQEAKQYRGQAKRLPGKLLKVANRATIFFRFQF